MQAMYNPPHTHTHIYDKSEDASQALDQKRKGLFQNLFTQNSRLASSEKEIHFWMTFNVDHSPQFSPLFIARLELSVSYDRNWADRTADYTY